MAMAEDSDSNSSFSEFCHDHIEEYYSHLADPFTSPPETNLETSLELNNKRLRSTHSLVDCCQLGLFDDAYEILNKMTPLEAQFELMCTEDGCALSNCLLWSR